MMRAIALDPSIDTVVAHVSHGHEHRYELRNKCFHVPREWSISDNSGRLFLDIFQRHSDFPSFATFLVLRELAIFVHQARESCG